MRPAVSELEQEYADRVTFVRLDYDVDDDLRIARELRADYHPAIVYMRADGSVLRNVIGYQSEDMMRDNIEALLAE
ncbi:MAG: hypothetical protein WD939_01880 [Dehalococcoidia bacterium]